MESVIILAGLIVMSVIDIKRKSIHIGMLTAMGVIVAGIRVVQSAGYNRINSGDVLNVCHNAYARGGRCGCYWNCGISNRNTQGYIRVYRSNDGCVRN